MSHKLDVRLFQIILISLIKILFHLLLTFFLHTLSEDNKTSRALDQGKVVIQNRCAEFTGMFAPDTHSRNHGKK